MYETILLPTDGSAGMRTVVEHARDIATRRDAAVYVVYVVDDRAFLTLDDSLVPDVIERLSSEGERATAAAATAFEADGLDVTTVIRKGTPAEEILAAVDDHEVDLVVMGSHGADPTSNLLGSTSRDVVTNASVPVLTVAVEDTAEEALDGEAADRATSD